MTSVEEVAVVLLGSPENFLGYNPPETATHGWRTSSDPMIMQLIQEGLEEEPDKFTDSDLLANAVDLSRDSIEAGRGVARAKLEALFRVRLFGENISLEHGQLLRSILVGTPLWVAHPRPLSSQV